MFVQELRKDPAAAAKMLDPDLEVDKHGNVLDKRTNQIVNRLPQSEYVNGWKVDPNDPNSPGYVPTLAPGIVPTPGGGVGLPQGYTSALAAEKGAEQQAVNAANWPGETATVKIGNQEFTMTKQEFADWRAGRGAGPAGAPAAGAPGAPAAPAAPAAAPGGPPGVAAQSASDTAFDVAQAGELSKTLSAAMAGRQKAMYERENARQALAYVQAHGNQMNPALPYQAAGANYLRSLDPDLLKAVGVDPAQINQYANDAQTYQRLANQGLLSFAQGNLPSRYTERELSLARPIIGALSTAPDAASFHWGAQLAMHNKEIQRAEAAANYHGPKNQQAFEAAWNASPEGKASLYEDPVWQHIQIGGQPAVIFTKDKNGHDVGVIGYGTASPQRFRPSWGR
jgi:hypothetical protein